MQLFNDEYSDLFSDMSEKFKNQTLFFKLKNNDKSLDIKEEDNIIFYDFLQNKNSHNKFNNIIKFYINYILDYIGYNQKISIFFDEIFYEYLEKIFKNGYLEKNDFDKLENSKNFDFIELKQYLFLDYSQDKDKIYITIEYLFGYLNTNSGEKLNDENIFIYSELTIIAQIFLKSDYENKEIIKTLKILFNQVLGLKLTNGELFYLVIYNKLYNFDSKKISSKQEFLAEKLKSIVEPGYLSKKIKSNYNIINDNLYKDIDFVVLFLINIVYLVDFGYGKEIIISMDFFEKYIDSGILDLKVVEDIGNLDSIKSDILENVLFDYKVNFISAFDETKNINKKNIKYTKKDLKDYKSSYFIKEGLEFTIKKIFSGCDDNSFNYRFLLPLAKASKRFINSNFNYTGEFDLNNKTIKEFIAFLDKHQDKFIEIESFIDNFFEENVEFFSIFSGLKNRYFTSIGRKIPDEELEFLIGERELVKRFFIYLAELGFLELFGNNIQKEVCYLSGDGFGYSYGLSRSYKEIDFFDIKYLKYKKIDLNIEIPKDNHISGNDIYLNLNINKYYIDELSRITELVKIDNYAILNISRDILIKAKNNYETTDIEVFNIFKNLNLEIPKNLKILISSALNQKEDLAILPVGIPVLLENRGVFNELKKLKTFNKYIIYENEVLNLIIFDESFRNLENLLSSRKIIFIKK